MSDQIKQVSPEEFEKFKAGLEEFVFPYPSEWKCRKCGGFSFSFPRFARVREIRAESSKKPFFTASMRDPTLYDLGPVLEYLEIECAFCGATLGMKCADAETAAPCCQP